MKIVMLTRLFWPHAGGVEKHVYRLGLELIKSGHEIWIITEKYDPILKKSETIEGMYIQRIRANSKLSIWKEILSLKDEIDSADIIHIHDVFWWFLPYILIRKKYYITFHGYEGSNPPRWQAYIQRKIADHVATGSICVGDFMRRWYGAKPDKVIYGAGEIKATPITSNNAAFWGRFDDDTGVLTYIEAMPLIKQSLQMHFYGDGAYMELMKKSNNPLIHVHGWSNDISKIILECKYAFVSRYLAILEAMQAKRLVVAVYNNEIKKDYLTCHPMAGNMIIASTPEELADRFNNLNTKTEQAMVEKAYEWAQTQTWDRLAKTYEGVWQIN